MTEKDAVPATKDEDAAHRVASARRPSLTAAVDAFVAKDYAVRRGPPSVSPVGSSIARQIEDRFADYGETLVALPDAAWNTSVSQWMGDHWNVLVDIWTEESGASDMVLAARVFESEDGFRVVIDSVHVP